MKERSGVDGRKEDAIQTGINQIMWHLDVSGRDAWPCLELNEWDTCLSTQTRRKNEEGKIWVVQVPDLKNSLWFGSLTRVQLGIVGEGLKRSWEQWGRGGADEGPSM